MIGTNTNQHNTILIINLVMDIRILLETVEDILPLVAVVKQESRLVHRGTLSTGNLTTYIKNTGSMKAARSLPRRRVPILCTPIHVSWNMYVECTLYSI